MVTTVKTKATTAASDSQAAAGPAALGLADLRQMLTAFMTSKTLMSGAELGVFDTLAPGPLTPPELAARLGLPASSLGRLLVALASLGLLRKEGDAYANAAVADEHLVRGRTGYIGGSFHHVGHDLYPLWNHLNDAVRENSARWHQAFGRDTGEDPFASIYRDETALRGFMSALAAATTPVARALCDAFDFGPYRRLLDVGGALGAMTATVVQAHPHLRGITFDLPAVRPLAAEYLAQAGLADRVQVAAGDMFAGPLPAGADVITLSIILHDWDDERALRILTQCHAALPSGGAVLVLEQLLNDDGTGPQFAALGSLNMLVATGGGRERSAREYAALLTQTGFVRPEVRRLGLGATLATARDCIVAWKP
jgi:hypothetical protein